MFTLGDKLSLVTWKHEPHDKLNNMNVRCRCLLNVGGSLSRRGSASLRRLHAHSADDAVRCANVPLGVLKWAKQLFMNDFKTKMAVWCSEEVVAKGKGHDRKTGWRQRGTRTRATNQRAAWAVLTNYGGPEIHEPRPTSHLFI